MRRAPSWLAALAARLRVRVAGRAEGAPSPASDPRVAASWEAMLKRVGTTGSKFWIVRRAPARRPPRPA
eukprot:3646182-Alexandrium_andersonii.AAC.1